MENILTFYDGNKEALNLLVVMAADAEYGAALKGLGVRPIMIGVGPINAAMNVTAVLKDMQTAGTLPHIVVNIGSAGSNVLENRGIYQASSISYRDMDASPFGFEKGHTPFSALPAKLPVTIEIPGVARASVSTGAQVVSGDAYGHFEEEIAEMEAYAVYSACLAFGIPMIKIVGISDGKEALSGRLEDWTQYLEEIDRKLAAALCNLKDALARHDISRDALLQLPEGLRRKAAA